MRRDMRMVRYLALVLACGSMLGAAAPLWAAVPPKRVIRLDAMKVEGRIQKPQAFYILQRRNLDFEALKLKRSFLPKILESIKEPPF
jgi:hypothetical protein